MARVKSKLKVDGLCLALLLCLPGPLSAGQCDNGLTATPCDSTLAVERLQEADPAEAEKQALSMNEQDEAANEPLYAGTSMWFLLSIALLGSIAVRRRVDPDD